MRSLVIALRRALGHAAVGFAALAACLATAGCAWNANAPPGSTDLDAAPVVVEGAWDGVLPIVEVHLDGRGPYRFLLDTGAESTFVTPACARDVGLDLEDAEVRIDAAGAELGRNVQRTAIAEVRLGDASFRSVAAVVTDMTGDLDGVLGFPVFADVLLTLDGPGRRIVLENGSLPSPEADPACVELLPGDQAFESPEVWGHLAGHRFRITIDSGFAGFAYLGRNFATDLGLDFEPDADVAASVSTEAGRRDVLIGRLHERLEVGALEFEDFPTITGMGPILLLGSEFLRESVTTFDQSNRRVRFAGLDSPP